MAGCDDALVGDWIICPADADVFDMAESRTTHVTPPERAAFQGFLDDGWAERSAVHHPPGLHLLGLLPPAVRA